MIEETIDIQIREGKARDVQSWLCRMTPKSVGRLISNFARTPQDLINTVVSEE